MKHHKILPIFLLLLPLLSVSQTVSLNWTNNRIIRNFDDSSVIVMNFDGAQHLPEYDFLPLFSENIQLAHNMISVNFKINEISEIPQEDIENVSGLEMVKQDFVFNYDFSTFRKSPVLLISVIPVRYNAGTSKYERLESFSYEISDNINISHNAKSSGKSYASTSVLNTGAWYKFYVSEDGFYKITYQDLATLGIDAASVNPKTVKIYGNGGRMLPELAGSFRYDDLHQVPIWVSGEDDGSFDTGDYILLYADGPHEWSYNQSDNVFMFSKNLYTTQTCYFITFGGNAGKRMAYRTPVADDAQQTLNYYTAYDALESTLTMPDKMKSGKRWLGEAFDSQTSKSFSFNFSNVLTSQQAKIVYRVAGRQLSNSSAFETTVEDYNYTDIFRPVGTTLGARYAQVGDHVASFTPSSNAVVVNMKFTKPETTASAWLCYIYLNVYCNLAYSSGDLFFRLEQNKITADVAEFQIATTANTSNLKVLDISDPVAPELVEFEKYSSGIKIKFNNDGLHQFVCTDGSNYKSVTLGAKIANQNIHGMAVPDMVIVYHELFSEQAHRLSNYHNSNGLLTYCLDIQNIYNEFSSGVQDLCAIRDMMKMWYEVAAEGNEPQYLLLFGDASYDPLDRVSSNTNFIPVYQSEESLAPSISYATDDFFGYLDDNEGLMQKGNSIDLAIGRFPVQDIATAKGVVDKILSYAANSNEQMGDWRNVITFTADDADKGSSGGYETVHLQNADAYASIVETNNKEYSTNKIYSGAYTQTNVAGRQRYPEVNDAINARIGLGTLIFCYAGHGGEQGLALEEIMTTADINSWRNYNKLAFFITATCEFSRYDDPARVAAGESVFLNTKGGAVSMLTTVRLTNVSGNETLCTNFFNNVFNKNDNNEYYNIGDICMIAKNATLANGYVPNTSSFVLFGDPAIPLNYPKYNKVEIAKILVDGMESDTIKALSLVTVAGKLLDFDGNVMENFNGIIYPEVHDKPTTVKTLGNDGAPEQTFEVDNSIIYKGQASVTNGCFEFNFITPKDISYKYDNAKMIFYFSDSLSDGNGYYDDYVVGGNSEFAENDVDGPEITMYINDTNFVSGNITNQNPVMYAYVYDENGINTTGNGIGHDIIAYLDSNLDKSYIMSSYYESELDSYTSGYITYPMFNIEKGAHSISLRAWDTYNNSSTAEIDFIVVTSDQIAIENLYNYPNPFYDKTTFCLNHNQSGYQLDATLLIFSVNGDLVKTITTSFFTNNLKDDVINWDGKNDKGSEVAKGVYVYKLILTNDEGVSSYSSGKLIRL
ncbi:MAG: type IX secretion system sortase PorU [Bacteroidales bacterium]|nr:type IX secretion system sortase PorU [Bacteroidales bacterium]